jgi:hypothetical protein
MLGIDCTVGIPLPWTIGEGPLVVALVASLTSEVDKGWSSETSGSRAVWGQSN